MTIAKTIMLKTKLFLSEKCIFVKIFPGLPDSFLNTIRIESKQKVLKLQLFNFALVFTKIFYALELAALKLFHTLPIKVLFIFLIICH